ncbi:MAG: nickel pincer cofactor biosynthesis protein LarC [Planctomycetes bacterium]|nr:nickel pincer cofactor biosynthesis protein LarC [Planctomycetota bacterium]
MRTAYIDAFSGVSGDMLVGALIDAGAPLGAMLEIVSGIPIDGFKIEARRESRGAFVGTRFIVHTTPVHEHRNLADIVSILERSALPPAVLGNAKDVFARIARAESAAHGIPEDRVHFHEVGAMDTIVDIVAACAGFHLLGIEQVVASAIELGSGTVHCAHGDIPVPAPGTMGILSGLQVRIGGLVGERTTPTGAALIATFASSVGEAIEIVPRAIGYGVGGRETTDVPNLLRVIIGEMESAADRVAVLECNLDDIDGESLGFVIEQALATGALDAFVTHVTMKKGRPGFVITVLSPIEKRIELEHLLFKETPTLGIRRHLAARSKLRREIREFTTPIGKARAKLRWLPGGDLDISAEYDDARRLALAQKLTLSNAVAIIEVAAREAMQQEPLQQEPLQRELLRPENVKSKQSNPKATHTHDHGHPHDHGNAHEHGHGHGHSNR